MKSTVIVKGDRMAMVAPERVTIIDLNAETMTDVDLKKNTYATITFAEMAKAMERMAQKMSQQKKPDGPEMQFTAKVTPTGQSRVISGFNTKETIVTLAMEGTDAKTGNKGAMEFTMDMWLAPNIPGYEEVRNFHQRMAQKVPWNPLGSAMGGMMSQHAKGMGELMKEMSKLEGVPVLQITKIGGTGTGMPTEADMAAAQQQAQQQAAQEPPRRLRNRRVRPRRVQHWDARAGSGTGWRTRRIRWFRPKEEDGGAAAGVRAASSAAGSGRPAAPAAPGSASLMEMTTEMSRLLFRSRRWFEAPGTCGL